MISQCILQEQSRTRPCNEAQFGGDPSVCSNPETETRACNEDCCELTNSPNKYLTPRSLSSGKVDGQWSDWGSFGSCSVSCGAGTRTKTRECVYEDPNCKGASCPGSSTYVEGCDNGAEPQCRFLLLSEDEGSFLNSC